MRIEKSPQTVFTPLDDGTGVLLNLETRVYFSLNRTGTAIWRELEHTSPSTLDDLIGAICDGFEIDEKAARKEVEAFVGQLETFRMVRVL